MFFLVLLLVFCLYFFAAVAITLKILKPGHRVPPPQLAPEWLKSEVLFLKSQKINFYSYIPHDQIKICVLQHGLGDCSLNLLNEAALLKKLNYGVVMMDLLGHGKSESHMTTFGRREGILLLELIEKLDLRERVEVLWGRSSGAAAVLYASLSLAKSEKLILDGMFDSEILSIWRHGYRLKKYWPSLIFMPLILSFLFLNKFRQPGFKNIPEFVKESVNNILFITGNKDVGAGPIVQKKLFKQSQNKNNRLILIEGAEHNQSFSFDPKPFEEWLGSKKARL